MTDPARSGIWGDIGAGAAIGLLVGALIGLSTSEVVGSAVAALTALLAAFFGLAPGSPAPGRVARVGAFALGALAGVGGGLYLRTHDSLSRSLNDRIAEWEAAGVDSTTSRRLVIFERTGLVGPGWTAAAPPDLRTRTTSTALFMAAAERCGALRPDNYPDTDELANAFELAESGWDAVAEATAGIPAARRRQILVSAWRLACESE